MNPEELKARLRALHQDLDAGGPVDPELKTLLELLGEDIHKLLDESDDTVEDHASVSERAEAAAARFTADHPQIAPILREIADALGRMGI